MRELRSEDRNHVVVGRPLPFSIYSADQTLLLAADRLVANEFVRDGLLRSGRFRDDERVDAPTEAADSTFSLSAAMAEMLDDYKHIHARATVGFRMERDGRMVTSRVIGVSEDGHGLIMTWPHCDNGAPIALREGERWMFRAFYAVAAIRFHASIDKIVSAPFRYFYASHIEEFERRNVRAWPRTPSCLLASSRQGPPQIIADLSVGGARIGVDAAHRMERGNVITLATDAHLALGQQKLRLDAIVLNEYGCADPKHPQVEFYGARFENAGDAQRLVIHAFVQEQLCAELDRVSHVLTIPH